jgi:hypothetical protein
MKKTTKAKTANTSNTAKTADSEKFGVTVRYSTTCPDRHPPVYAYALKVEVTRAIKEKGLHNVNFFSAPDPLSMEASISRMQDLVIAAPDSTN